MEESIRKTSVPEECGRQNETEKESLLDRINAYFGCEGPDIRSYSPLTLAYIGDAIYDLIIRSVVVERANCPANDLHRKTVQYVKAETQSAIALALLEDLDEEEKAVFRRGRNAKSYTTAKNASKSDYHKATGLEALIGYLYLTNRTERLLYLIKRGIEKIGRTL